MNIGEPWAPGEVEEEVLKGNEKGFITSPADIDPWEPIKLRDAEVTPEHRKAFEDLCSEFETIFSRDSADLGKTPLLKMDIPTGDNPPITQRPYTLAQTCTVGTRRNRDLRKGRDHSKKCISMG